MSGFYRGPGGTGDATGDAVNQAVIAIGAANSASASATAASTSETNASTSATSAATSATNAAASATAAATSATDAANSVTSALLKANNLNDLTSVSSARTNLGLVASATTDTTNASNISSGTLPAGRLPAHTGDATSTAGSAALTLATVNSNVGSFGSSSSVPVVTVNAKGLVTAVSTSSISSGMKNRLINSGFTFNQRTYVSNTALSVGVYGHDRWKAGASGCTYTFTQLSAGVPIVITITAGSIQQVIEGCNIPDGGTFVLSWTGTAQGRFNGGTYGSSPLAVTGLTAGANCTIEFNTGTLSYPQLEVGSVATGFEYRQYQQELALCQRYFERLAVVYMTTAWSSVAIMAPYKVQKRTTPTIINTPDGGSGGLYTSYGATGLPAGTEVVFQTTGNSAPTGGSLQLTAEL